METNTEAARRTAEDALKIKSKTNDKVEPCVCLDSR
jgi:hypothetical protein